MRKHFQGVAIGLLAGAIAAPSLADEGKSAGDIMVRGRAIAVVPHTGGDVSVIGGDPDATTEVVPELDFTYFITDNIALELIAATTRHDVKVKNSALGTVDLGKVSVLPPTLTLQYHFLPKSDFSPYVGIGINYTLFYNADAPGGAVTSIDYDNSVGPAFQVGFDYRIAPNWYLNLDVKKLLINTDVKVNGGAIRGDADLDPWIIGLGVGYKF